jgi:uncharacterized membrane protein YcjF (UPF0283 family)
MRLVRPINFFMVSEPTTGQIELTLLTLVTKKKKKKKTDQQVRIG